MMQIFASVVVIILMLEDPTITGVDPQSRNKPSPHPAVLRLRLPAVWAIVAPQDAGRIRTLGTNCPWPGFCCRCYNHLLIGKFYPCCLPTYPI